MSEERWRALVGRKWSELEAIELEGRALYFDTIRRRRAKGDVEEVRIGLRVLRPDQARQAFWDAVRWAQREGVLPKELGNMENLRERVADRKLFENMENLCILARAIREPRDPYEQKATPEQLESGYDLRSLDELWSKYKIYEDITDPRDSIKTETEMWSAVAAVGEAGNLLPLTAIASHEQNACIVFMAKQALTSPAFSSFATSFASSTRAA